MQIFSRGKYFQEAHADIQLLQKSKVNAKIQHILSVSASVFSGDVNIQLRTLL